MLQEKMGTVVINNALKMLTAFFQTVNVFVYAMMPNTELDLYCRGMVFGLEGSKMAVKFSNIILANKDKYSKQPASASDGMKGGRKVDPVAAGF